MQRYLTDTPAFGDNLLPSQRGSIDYFRNQDGKVKITFVDDKTAGQWTDSQVRVAGELERRMNDAEAAGLTSLRDDYSNMRDEVLLGEEGRYKSLVNKSIADAQGYLGTHMYNVGLIPKGATAGYGHSGWKPTGHYTDYVAGTSAILKTNFVYDRQMAEVLDAAGIDVLMMKTGAKELSSSESLIIPDGQYLDANGRLSFLEAMNSTITGDLTPYTTLFDFNQLDFGPAGTAKDGAILTHALFNWLGPEASDQLINKGGLQNRLNQVKKSIQDVKDLGRIGAARAYFDRGDPITGADILENSSMGLTRWLLEQEVDPYGSSLIRDSVNRRVKQITIDGLSRIYNEDAYYSVLTPDASLSMPVYKTVGNMNRQTIIGGIKAPNAAAYKRIGDTNRLTFSNRIDDGSGSRDVIIVNENGKWVMVDPLDSGWAFTGSNALRDIIIGEVKTVVDYVSKYKNNTYGDLWATMKEHEMQAPELKDFSIIAQDVRIPSTTSSDVVLNKLEGFHNSRNGNVASVNMLELATKHQGDFDVDKLFMYFNLPDKVVREIYQRSGDVPDVYSYPSDSSTLDMWENGRSMSRAGSQNMNDGAAEHNSLVHELKMKFGTSVRAMSAGTFLSNVLGDISVGNMHGRIRGWTTPGDNTQSKQRVGNVSQTTIDSFMGQSGMVGDKGFNTVEYEIDGTAPIGKTPWERGSGRNQGWYREPIGENQDFIDYGGIQSQHRGIIREGIKEMFRVAGSMDTVFSDIYPQGTPRRPEYNELMRTYRRALHMLEDPNSFVFWKLRKKYYRLSKNKNEAIRSRGIAGLSALQKVFIPDAKGTYISSSQFIKDMAKKDFKSESLNTVFQTKEGYKSIDLIQNSPAGKILHEIASYNIFSDQYPFKGKIANQAINIAESIVDRIEFIKLLNTGEKSTEEGIKVELDQRDIMYRVGESGRMRVLPDEGMVLDFNNMEEMAAVRHVLQSNRKRTMSYIRGLDNHRFPLKNNLIDARERLDDIKSTLEWLDGKESWVKRKTIDEFRVNDYDLTRAKKGRFLKNNSEDTWHVYINRGTDDRPKLSSPQNNAVYKGGRLWMNQGNRYVVIRKPIRYVDIDLPSVKDGWAMLSAVSADEGGHIPEKWFEPLADEIAITDFYQSFSALKRKISGNFTRTWKLTKRQPMKRESWMWNLDEEAAAVNEFMTRWTRDQVTDTPQGENGQLQMRVQDLVRTMLSPDPVGGKVAYSGDVVIPTFKVNSRLSKAVIYWARNAGHEEMVGKILGDYGKLLSASIDNVDMDRDSMYRSRMFHRTDQLAEEIRPFALDAFFGMEDLYHPVLAELKRGNQGFRKRSRVLSTNNNWVNIHHFNKGFSFRTPVEEYFDKGSGNWKEKFTTNDNTERFCW